MISQNAWFAREGRVWIAACLIGMLFLHGIYGMLVLPLWLPIMFFMWIMRDPRRQVPSAPLAIISPVDGTVVSIEECTAPFYDKESYRISIRMSWSGVFILRSITEGKIIQYWINKGDKESPYSYCVWLQTDEQDDLVLAIRPGRWFGRIACYVSTGERVGQGQHCGFIPLGSPCVDVFLPVSSTLAVAKGDKLRSGESILGKLVHS